MSWYTRLLNSLGEKESRRIELTLGKKIKEYMAQLKTTKAENVLLRDMLVKAEKRHINDITSINAKLDAMSQKLNDWVVIAEENKAELLKTQEIARFAEEQRDMWMKLVESALEKYPDLKLSQLLKMSRKLEDYDDE